MESDYSMAAKEIVIITDKMRNDSLRLSTMSARPAGLEPATFGFEVRDSIH